MLYEKPLMEILKLPLEDVVCTSDKFFNPDNPDNNSDMNDEVWD